VYQFFVGEDERKHQQGDGKKDEEEGEFKIKIGWQPTCTKIECEDKKKKKMVATLSNKGNIIFLEMKKFQQWIVGRNVEWARNINAFGLLGMQLSLI
jgi:hypothetical protein